jgi:hypothetical protein
LLVSQIAAYRSGQDRHANFEIAGYDRCSIKLTAQAMNKFVQPRPFANPEAAARKLMEIANQVEPVQDGRIHIEKINGPFLFQLKGTPAEYKAGLDLAIAKGWLVMHESGTFVKFTEAGAELFA